MSDFAFQRIAPRPIEYEILSSLRQAIVSGQFPPGAHLNESEIAKQMNVSRIPIREAVKKLEQEGLVVRHPNRGVKVTTFSEQDIREIFSLRARLEGMAIEWAIPRITPEDIAKLQALVEEQKVAISKHKHDELTRLDMRFHEFICQKAGYPRLLKIWYELHAQGQMLLNLRFNLMSDYTPETVQTDHLKILEAIERQDTASAIQLTNEISERVIHECIDALAEYTAALERSLIN